MVVVTLQCAWSSFCDGCRRKEGKAKNSVGNSGGMRRTATENEYS